MATGAMEVDNVLVILGKETVRLLKQVGTGV